MTAPVAVLFVSAAPIHPGYPGGFASRHRDVVAAVAGRERTAVRFLTSSPAEHEDHPCDLAVETDVITIPRRSPRRHGVRLPRQSIARDVRIGTAEAELVVTLLPSLAHLVLDRGDAVCVLEEGTERGLQAVPGLSDRSRRVERWRHRTLYRRIGRRGVPVVAITTREARHFGRWIAAERIHVVPFGIDAERYACRPDVLQDIDVLVPSAVNRPEQRVEDLVRALRADPATQGAVCVAAGAGARPSLLDMRSATTLVPGYAPDLRDLIARSRVVAIPTFTDVGIKTTMLQSWAMGRPVVTSPAVLDGAPPGLPPELSTAAASVQQMATQIGALLRTPERCAEIGRAGRRFVLAHHDRGAAATAFADVIIDELAQVRHARRARPAGARTR